MSGSDPFDPQDTTPNLEAADRRESLRADIPAKVKVEGTEELLSLPVNVSLNGVFIDQGNIPPVVNLEGVPVEMTLDLGEDHEPVVINVVLTPPDGRPGLMARLSQLPFELERKLARILDFSTEGQAVEDGPSSPVGDPVED